jgi:hypothetical protein
VLQSVGSVSVKVNEIDECLFYLVIAMMSVGCTTGRFCGVLDLWSFGSVKCGTLKCFSPEC